MAVQIGLAPGLQARNRKTERNHAPLVVSAESVAADFGRDDEEPNRQKLDIGKAPDGFLQRDGFAKLLFGMKLLDGDFRPGSPRPTYFAFVAQALDSCHSDSSSSMGVPATCLPCAA